MNYWGQMQSLSQNRWMMMSDNSVTRAQNAPRAAVSAAIFHGGRVLLVQRGQPPDAGAWSLPGGHIEPGEAAIDAVERELHEETAIRAKILDIAGIKDVVQQNDRGAVIFHRVIIVFCGFWLAGEARAGSDVSAVAWQDMDGLGALSLTEGLAEMIAKAERKLNEAGR
jgi:ADP-ribose pyrophosphatase YjhB (NUDIX family)